MKKIIFISLLHTLLLPFITFAQVDTLYYDKEWNGMADHFFASYYRIIPKSIEEGVQKPYRDYYITGELESEGYYLSIDKYDDSKSVFDGEYTNYYKSGKVAEKGTFKNGLKEGEYIRYKENGLIELHCFYENDKFDGLHTQFSEDGETSFQIEYVDGEPKNNWIMVSNKEGRYSKIDINTEEPIYESPLLSERQIEYKNGEPWSYYNYNGIMMGMTCKKVDDYGIYYQIPIVIYNNSLFAFNFDPTKITAAITTKDSATYDLVVLSADDYMRKVEGEQSLIMGLAAVAGVLAASTAAHTTSTTYTTYSGFSTSLGSDYFNNSYYYGSAISTTTTDNAVAAYQASVIANNLIATEGIFSAEKEAKNKEYLKLTTIYPGETISGYINIRPKKKSGGTLSITIDLNGALYNYLWEID